ncbi:Fibrous sheath-interacting protein 2 [Plecturocebus cupreus]
MKDTGFKGENMGKNTLKYKGQDGTHGECFPKNKRKTSEDIILVYLAGHQNTYEEISGNTATAAHQSQNNSKNFMKKTSTSVVQANVQDNGINQKRDGMVSKNSSIVDDRGDTSISGQGNRAWSGPQQSYSREARLLEGKLRNRNNFIINKLDVHSEAQSESQQLKR